MKVTSTRDLAAIVKGRRHSLGLSQAKLARIAGVSRPWLSKVESGKTTTEIGLLIRLLDALGLTLLVDDRSDESLAIDLDALIAEYEKP
jgi:y4mF family transcriptional regulator